MSNLEIPKESGFLVPDFVVYFTESESHSIADSLSAGSTAAGFIPDPTVSTVVAATGAILALMARRAIRQGRKVGVKIWMPWRLNGPWIRPFTY
jgi:hypothetical protein